MKNDGRVKDLETICVIAAGALAIGLLSGRHWLSWAALGLLLAGAFSARASAWIAAGWMRFGELLGKVNSKVILFLVFYLALVPVAFLYRLFTKDPLRLAKLPGGGSYFHDRGHAYVKGDLENAW